MKFWRSLLARLVGDPRPSTLLTRRRYHGRWTRGESGLWQCVFTPPVQLPPKTHMDAHLPLPPPWGAEEFDVEITFRPGL